MSDLQKKNIVVTGGAGFIGSHLCEQLLRTGDAHVICVDNFSTSQESNIDHLLQEPNFEFIRHDIVTPFDPEAFPELLRFNIKVLGIDEIYHLACPTSPKKFDQYKMQTLYANSIGMKHVLDLAQRYRSRVLFTSSSVVYGSRPVDGHPFTEDELGCTNMLSPRACYDEGKRFAESYCATYTQVHGIDTRIARIFRTYGPRMPLYDGQMIPDFITSALDGHDVEIFGDRDFRTALVYVSDVVDGLIKLMQHPTDIGPVNFGHDQDTKLADVAQRIIEMTGSTSQVKYCDPLLFMSQLGLPSIVKAKEHLDWLPLVTLENGLKQTIDYTMSHKSLLGFKGFGI